MRQPDINRAKRALEHVEAAMTLLESIKWENVSGEEYTLKQSCNRLLKDTEGTIQDLVRIGGGKI